MILNLFSFFETSPIPRANICILFFPPGRRADTDQRPELSRGSYEFLATTDYCKGSKLPQSAAYIFCIDVSFASFQSGVVQVRDGGDWEELGVIYMALLGKPTH